MNFAIITKFALATVLTAGLASTGGTIAHEYPSIQTVDSVTSGSAIVTGNVAGDITVR